MDEREFDKIFPDQVKIREAARAEREKLGVTLEGVAWVVAKLREHMKTGGTYRYLVYTQMGLPRESDAYCALLDAGLMEVHNRLLPERPEDLEA